MKYVGFWKRFIAGMIDLAVLYPLYYIPYIFNAQSKYSILGQNFAELAFYILYIVILHAKYGQTVGKMIMKIKVIKLSGEDISLSDSLRRFSIDLLLTFFGFISLVYFLTSMSGELFTYYLSSTSGDNKSYDLEITNLFKPYVYFHWLVFVWGIMELLTLLFNKKKRAFHDLIGRTVVIEKG